MAPPEVLMVCYPSPTTRPNGQLAFFFFSQAYVVHAMRMHARTIPGKRITSATLETDKSSRSVLGSTPRDSLEEALPSQTRKSV